MQRKDLRSEAEANTALHGLTVIEHKGTWMQPAPKRSTKPLSWWQRLLKKH